MTKKLLYLPLLCLGIIAQANTFDLLQPIGSAQLFPELQSLVDEAYIYQLNPNELKHLRQANPNTLALEIPFGNASIQLEFTRKVNTNPPIKNHLGEVIGTDKGMHFSGSLTNQSASIAALSIFEDDIMGLWATPGDGNWILGQWKDYYIIQQLAGYRTNSNHHTTKYIS